MIEISFTKTTKWIKLESLKLILKLSYNISLLYNVSKSKITILSAAFV